MFYAQHVACYDSGSVERPISSDGFFLIRCKMQMESVSKAMEYITKVVIATCKKHTPRCISVVITNAFAFYIDKQVNVIY